MCAMAIDKETNLIWIDLEMTGLNPDTDRIIEMATIVTDVNLNVLAEGPVIAVHQKDIVLIWLHSFQLRNHRRSSPPQSLKLKHDQLLSPATLSAR